jgi:uncharacterized protein YbaR (Trm112 family)
VNLKARRARDADRHTWVMDDGATARDLRRMAAIGRSLAAIERDDAPAPAQSSAARAAADQFRVRHGIPPLVDDECRPEEEFYRRARALGFRRSRG